MAVLRATLFETLRLYAPDGRSLDLGSPTTRSLIAYLLINRGRPSDRRRLAFLFWPRATESAARRNLRQYLHHIRAALAPVDQKGDLLLADGANVQFNPQADFSLDVETFLRETLPEASLTEVKRALSLYSGDLLEDIYDDWCVVERDRLRQLWLTTLDRYSQALQSSGQLNEALAIVQKWIAAEPFDETAQRRLMQLYALNGDRARAIHAYQAFAKILESEIGTAPLPETQALLQSIQSGQAPTNLEIPHINSAQRRGAASPQYLPAKPALPFVGRQREIAALEEAYQQAKAGSGRLVFITGEAGIGKTRLLQEYLALHTDSPGLQSSCYELDSLTPFAPLYQAFENSAIFDSLINGLNLQFSSVWAAPLIPLLPALARHFPYASPPGNQTDPNMVREAFINLLIQLSATCRNNPLHLILDDLHWADTPAWELLAALARRVTSSPLLIIGLFRVEDMPAERLPLFRTIQRSDHCLTFELPRLNPDETADLARQLNPNDASDSIFVQRLYHETEGNPFFIVETVRALQETGGSRAAMPSSSVPYSIQRVIEARLDRLAPTSREALTSAAAIGRSFTPRMLQEILQASSEDLLALIEEWLQRGLIHEGTQGYDFRHDKFRQVAYAGLTRARREYIHGRIADVLENAIPKANVTTLAYHYSRSDQTLKTLPFLTQAGEQALRLRSYHEARQFGLQAVNLLGQLPGPRQRGERIDINLQLAQAYAFTGDLHRALEILQETEQFAFAFGDERRLGQVFRRAAQFFWLNDQAETASDYARRALRVAEDLPDSELHYASLRMLGRAGIALAAYDDAIAYLLRYVTLYDEAAETTPQAQLPGDLSIVLGYLGVAYSRVGAWERAYHSARRGLNIAEAATSGTMDARSVFARMQLAMIEASHRKWDTCLETLDAIAEPQASEEITPPLYMALSLRGYALANRGKSAQGIRAIQAAMEWAERTKHRVFHYLPRLFLAESLLITGQTRRAQAENDRALKESQQAGNRWATGIALKLSADIGARLGKPDWSQVESDLIESMNLFRQIRARPDLARTYLSLRRLYDRAGQTAWAVDCHFRATTIFDELGMDEELRLAQGQAAGERRGAVVISDMPLRGPNVSTEESKGKGEAGTKGTKRKTRKPFDALLPETGKS
ncbi:MAG: AAA family ATPase [Chloroflexi bacterium]|nr:AAA family ATPase [Chloroflexota bacterium]